ncbi:TetR family transcriptional regulator C-terminal domain-containing protein [Flavobacterium muglaense]|uniref:TetR/AcrR family transcriptional regulator n=1 Tax=Flavobacterium muglaense TaxID=2764716 RepID=A0A923N3L9_9FLAO|nr:TetR family transcriptional regulator C-terminal domain-containing protein [Flavobacterium muglaense]MBC5839462.1 TetR/AcrR family transcriptional regulator [Flavobacterium muglaense]MBC5845974.1 TetR/AcrR family transcriptional regulator [Flavobacterium muglaense]
MATKKAILSKDKIVSMYMDYTLENNEKPKSVYQFMKLNGHTENEFYSFFGSIEGIEKEIYVVFLEKTVELLHQNKDYETYDMKTKMLSFYFTFFELLTANRSYVVMSLKAHQNQLKNLMQLSDLRVVYKDYVLSILTDDYRIKNEKVQEYQEKAISEGSWIQFLMTLKFWLEDSSPAFEKTDIYIEKSVKATFELMNISPLESLIDFGKFMFKEKIQKKS